MRGVNPVGNASEYELRHLVSHLEQSGRAADLHRLLALETDEHRNAWYEAKDAVGDAPGFVVDVTLAWRQAEEAKAYGSCSRELASIGLDIRYALGIASVRSLLGNVHPRLWLELVKRRYRTAAQAMAYSRSVEDATLRVRIFAGLVPYLPGDVQQEIVRDALAAAQADWSKSPDSFARLVPFIPEQLLPTALAVAQEASDRAAWLEMLVALARRLPPAAAGDVWLDAFRIALRLDGEDARRSLLTEIANQLPEGTRSELAAEALHEALDKERFNPERQVIVFARLGQLVTPTLRNTLLEDALAAARRLPFEEGDYSDWHYKDAERRAWALAALVPLLDEAQRSHVLEEALEAVSRTGSRSARAEVLATLVPYLPQAARLETLKEAVEMLREPMGVPMNPHRRARAWRSLAPLVTEPLLEIAVKAIQSIPDLFHQSWALAGLAAYMSDGLREKALGWALSMIEAEELDHSRAEALIQLTSQLPVSLAERALTTASGIADEKERARALDSLAPYLPDDLLDRAFAIARAIRDADYMGEALATLAPEIPREQREVALGQAFTAAMKMRRHLSAPHTLTRLAQHLPEPLRQQAFEGVLAAAASMPTSIDQIRAEVLSEVAPQLPPELLSKAVDIAQTMKWSDLRATALAGIAPHLGEPLKSQLLEDALSVLMRLEDDEEIADAIRAMAPKLPRPLLLRALSKLRSLQSSYGTAWVQAMTTLAVRLPSSERAVALSLALAAARKIQVAENRAEALCDVAGRLTRPSARHVLQEALAAAEQVTDAARRARALTTLAPQLSRDARKKAFYRAFRDVRACGDDTMILRVVLDAAPHIHVSLWKEALASASEVRDDLERGVAFARLLPVIPEAERTPIVREIRTLLGVSLARQNRFTDAKHVNVILAALPLEAACSMLPYVLHRLATPPRSAALSTLMKISPSLKRLGSEACAAAFGAIRDVHRWWP